MTAAEAQVKLQDIGMEFEKLSHQLYRVAVQLPRPANQDEMFECLIPCDLVSGIYGAIEFIREDLLSQVIEGLQDAATLTVEELERRFRKLQVQNGGGKPRGSR